LERPGLALIEHLCAARLALEGPDSWSIGPVPGEHPERPCLVPPTMYVKMGLFGLENLATEALAEKEVYESLLVLTHAKTRGSTAAVATAAIYRVTQMNATYDYVIVDSGAGGAAYRLAQTGAFLSREPWLDRAGRTFCPEQHCKLGGKAEWDGAAMATPPVVKPSGLPGTAHACGTPVAGLYPEASVVDASGRVHCGRGLCVVDGGILPTGTGVGEAPA
jgi:hypothetical protein